MTNPVALASIAVGSLFLYSGIKGAAFTSILLEVVQGKTPTPSDAHPITGSVDGSSDASSGGTASAGSLAGDAEMFVGKVPYVWGGASPNGWDCSGMVNYLLSTSMGHAIPGVKAGQSFSGHGPTTLGYLAWTGATTIPRSEAQASDLACWQSHIGVFVSNSEMVSAVDEAQGTAKTAVQGPIGEILICRRIT